jgi:hypothetical protein
MHRVMFFATMKRPATSNETRNLSSSPWFEPAICSPYTRLELFFTDVTRC